MIPEARCRTIMGILTMNQDLVVVVTTLSLYFAAVVSPGPSFAFISRLAVSGARSAALGAALGLAIGATLYALLTMAGLAVLLEQIGWLTRLIQLAGGCYLIYLGIGAWRGGGPAAAQAAQGGRDTWYGVRAGALVCLSNPKAVAFFVGLYAVAIPHGTALWAKATIIGGGFAIEIVWNGLVAVLLCTPYARAVYDRFRVAIERAMRTALAFFGLRLLWEKA
jgi:threonine/homoserine/homoserine lactone efflux protein